MNLARALRSLSARRRGGRRHGRRSGASSRSSTLPRQEDPVIAWRLANVVTRLPGASPSRVETLITDVLEQTVERSTRSSTSTA